MVSPVRNSDVDPEIHTRSNSSESGEASRRFNAGTMGATNRRHEMVQQVLISRLQSLTSQVNNPRVRHQLQELMEEISALGDSVLRDMTAYQNEIVRLQEREHNIRRREQVIDETERAGNENINAENEANDLAARFVQQRRRAARAEWEPEEETPEPELNPAFTWQDRVAAIWEGFKDFLVALRPYLPSIISFSLGVAGMIISARG